MGLLGIDVGTSGCKATAIDLDGRILGQASQEYPLKPSREGRRELDPDVIWQSVQKSIRAVTSRLEGKKIAALSVSSFGESVVPVDGQGNALGPAILYTDSRGEQEIGRLAMPPEEVLRITGAKPHAMYSLGKVLWYQHKQPEMYAKTWKYFLLADFVLFKLGAQPHTDYSLAARTQCFDVVKKEFSQTILDAAGLDADKWAQPVPSGTAVGVISQETARALGLPGDVILVSGGHDQPCAALGTGAIEDGLAVDGLGTSECLTPAFDRPVISERMAAYHFACVPHVAPGLYVTYAFCATSGGLLRWYRDTFGKGTYDEMVEEAVPCPSPVMLLPHFAGAATPYMDHHAKGMMAGLSIDTTQGDILKAILEGITFEIMVNQECLQKAGIQVKQMRTVGGLSRSDAYLQLKADMMGTPVVSMMQSEAGALGVAMLAGVAAGLYSSLPDAAAQLVKTKRVFEPNPALTAVYREKFVHYKRMYALSKALYSAEEVQ